MSGLLSVTAVSVRSLRFDDGAPVRAASGITPFEGGWLVVSDDSVHAALWTEQGITRVPVLRPVGGRDVFDAQSGTKHLKPDLEAACRVHVDGVASALLLGSGSLPVRTRAVLIEEGTRHRIEVDLGPLYRRVAVALEIPFDRLNLEGACLLSGALRWYQRGNAHLGVPSASVDVDMAALLAAVRGESSPEAVPVMAPQIYDLGAGDGSSLAVTDALALPSGRVLVSAVREDAPNAVDDGPVVDAALLLLDGQQVVARASLLHGPSGPHKVEGLALAGIEGATARVIAVSDADDPTAPSQAVELAVAVS